MTFDIMLQYNCSAKTFLTHYNLVFTTVSSHLSVFSMVSSNDYYFIFFKLLKKILILQFLYMFIYILSLWH